MDLITINRKRGPAFDVHVRRRMVKTDRAPEDGGMGLGFTPAELFAGSLGACIAMSVQGYCDACGFTEGDVSVCLAFELQGKHRRIGAISVDVELPAGVPEDRREAVRRVAEQAVICETLRHPPEVDLDIQFVRQLEPSLDELEAAGP